jgi:GMP synthase (glutamine-hydrolysing)
MPTPVNKPLLIMQTGHAPDAIRKRHDNFPQMFIHQGNINPQQLQIVDLQAGEQPLPPDNYAGALITGSRCMVTEHLDWSEHAASWIRQATKVQLPMFGACYGHQLMAYALGGKVGYHPQGIELGCLEIELLPAALQDPATQQLPRRFYANLVHMQTVLTPPAGAKVLARSQHDPHQILRYTPQAFSSQFHPEFSLEIMKSYVSWLAEHQQDSQINYTQRQQQLTDTPHSRSLLQHFVAALGKQQALFC